MTYSKQLSNSNASVGAVADGGLVLTAGACVAVAFVWFVIDGKEKATKHNTRPKTSKAKTTAGGKEEKEEFNAT